MLVQFAAKIWREGSKEEPMPLHYGKIFAIVGLLTIVAFVLWQLWIGVFAGVKFDQKTSTPHTELPLEHMAPA